MPRRPVPPPILTVSQIRRELARVISELEYLSSRWDLTNGQLRYRVKLLERRLRYLHARLRRPRS